MRRHSAPDQDSARLISEDIPPELLLAELNPVLPHEFAEAAHVTAGYVTALDQDPESALEQPGVRTFVQGLALTGFIGSVYIRSQPLFGGPSPRQALPGWLQPEFLGRHGLGRAPQLTEGEEAEVEQLFGATVQGLPYRDTDHGRYYHLPHSQSAARITEYYKYYVESHALLGMLRDGKLPDVLGVLAAHDQSPSSLKLYDADRVVFYFEQPVGNGGDQVRGAFLANGVDGRGPAQDVFEVVQRDGQLRVEIGLSNDAALGDAARNPMEYTAVTYSPSVFLDAYLRCCLYVGKNPSEPYKTSFVYAILSDAERTDSELLEQAVQLTGYPVVAAPSRRALSLLA